MNRARPMAAGMSVKKYAGRSLLILFEERLSPSFSTDLN